MFMYRHLLSATCLLLLGAWASRAGDTGVSRLMADPRGPEELGFYAGASAQFTRFSTLHINGHQQPNPTGQHLNSTVTEGQVGYHFTDRIALQLNVPYLHRSWTRPSGFATDSGSLSGVGDATMLGKYTLVKLDREGVMFRWDVYGGVKLPTGDSGRLAEEPRVVTPGAPLSGISGHDLALGSGSYDFIIGTREYLEVGSGFVSEALQYTVRTTGDHGYRYGNDLSWEGGPGTYIVQGQTWSLALQGVVSGTWRAADQLNGQSTNDSALTALYAGPKLLLTWQRLCADVGVQWPIIIHNSGAQETPTCRVIGGLSYRF